MNWKRPSVRLIGATVPRGAPFIKWIEELCEGNPSIIQERDDALGHLANPHWRGEDLIEASGRRCYKSLAVGIHSNVKSLRASQTDFLQNIIKQRHGSVLEHVSANFAIEGGSRIFTHELVRHRPGMAYSQESQRFVALDSITMTETPLTRQYLTTECLTQRSVEAEFEPAEGIERHRELLSEAIQDHLGMTECFLQTAREHAYAIEGFDINDPEAKIPFTVRKRVTSWLRRFAPAGVATGIVATANLRALRHLIPIRTSEGAEEEIAEIFDQVAKICVNEWPAIFFDFKRKDRGGDMPGVWTCEYEKV